MRLAAALLLCFVPMTGLAAPPARAHVLQADRSDVSAPLALLAAAPAEEDEEEVEHGPGRVPHQVQAAPPEHDPVLQASVAPLLLPQTSTNFDGIGLGFLGVNTRAFEVNGVPPDPQGDVGAVRLLLLRFSRLSEARRLAGRLLRHLQHVRE